jgi:hypothetical protein
MAYTPTEWKDRIVQNPRTFQIQNNADGTVTLTPKPGTVVQEGTPVNAANLNNIEQGLSTHVVDIATDENLGHVKVDGETITASNGIISAQIEDIVTGDKWVWGMEDGVVFLEKVVV